MLAFGDSITNGGGELQWGVAMTSWALWVARALGLPYTGYARDGATVADVVESQIEMHRRVAPDTRYDLGCLYIGTNDVRSVDWHPELFASRFAIALVYLAERCDRTLVVTIPLDLGRPRAGAKVEEANRIIEQVAAGALLGSRGGDPNPRSEATNETRDVAGRRDAAAGAPHSHGGDAAAVELDAATAQEQRGQGALLHRHAGNLPEHRFKAAVLDLRGFRGRRVLMADHVHPTAFGQIAIARRALAVLADPGMPTVVDPWELVSYETTRWGRLRGDATYAYRHAKVSVRAAAIVLLVRLGLL